MLLPHSIFSRIVQTDPVCSRKRLFEFLDLLDCRLEEEENKVWDFSKTILSNLMDTGPGIMGLGASLTFPLALQIIKMNKSLFFHKVKISIYINSG